MSDKVLLCKSNFNALLYLSLQYMQWHTTRNHIRVTCDHAWNDEWEDDELQHSHEDLPWEAEVLLVEIGQGRILPDHDAQTDAWKIGREKSNHKEFLVSAEDMKSWDHRAGNNDAYAEFALHKWKCHCHCYFRGRPGFIHAEFIVGLYFPAINLTCIPLNDFSDAPHASICYHTYQTTIKDTCKTLRWHSNLCISAMKSLIYRNGTYTLTSVDVTHQHSVFYIQQAAEYFSYPPTVLTAAAVPTCTDDILTLPPSGNGSC